MRGLLPTVIFIAAFLNSVVAGADSKQEIERIVAVVGSEIVLMSEVRIQAEAAIKDLEKASQGGADLMLDQRKSKVLKDALEQIIDETLVGVEAREMKLAVSSDEVDRAIANMAKENGVDVETLKKAVEAQGMDISAYRSKLRSQILRFKVLNLKVRGRVKISEAEARQYYNDQIRDVRATGTFKGAHILVRISDDISAAKTAGARKRAEAILARVKAGENFEAVAREKSEDSATAKGGGSLGELHPGKLPSVLDRAFLDLETGEIAGPIRTEAGFHIIKLINRQALGVQSFSEVKDRIVNQLAQEEMQRQERIWLKELRLKTFIETHL